MYGKEKKCKKVEYFCFPIIPKPAILVLLRIRKNKFLKYDRYLVRKAFDTDGFTVFFTIKNNYGTLIWRILFQQNFRRIFHSLKMNGNRLIY